MSIYNFTVKDREGNPVSLEDYKGSPLLIINSATECGFTPQYDDLQDLYEKYADQGLKILDFPCNQFGNQAPGSSDDIHQFCSSRFGITFPIFDKIEVNGDHADPLFLFLQKEKAFGGFNPEHEISPILIKMFEESNPNYADDPSIKWNFTKFLIDKDGNVSARFEPTDFMEDVEDAVKGVL